MGFFFMKIIIFLPQFGQGEGDRRKNFSRIGKHYALKKNRE